MKNKVIIITGGNGNVGQCAATTFAEQGARIFLFVRKDLDKAEKFIKRLPNQELKHEAFLASVTDTPALQTAIEKIKNTAGRCDLLINTAGITVGINKSNLENYTDEIVDEILINNVRGTFAAIREIVPLLSKGEDSLIVNITSASALRASPSNIIYGASKSAIELLTRTLSKSLAPKIRIVSICPGILEHPTSGAIKPVGWNEKMAQEIPLRRVGTAEDVVNTIEALYTKLTYVNGSSIILDGGRLA